MDTDTHTDAHAHTDANCDAAGTAGGECGLPGDRNRAGVCVDQLCESTAIHECYGLRAFDRGRCTGGWRAGAHGLAFPHDHPDRRLHHGARWGGALYTEYRWRQCRLPRRRRCADQLRWQHVLRRHVVHTTVRLSCIFQGLPGRPRRSCVLCSLGCARLTKIDRAR